MITETNITDWQAELERVRARLAEAEEELRTVAALALAGDDDAEQRRDALLDERATLHRRADELTTGVDSGHLHIERQERERAEAERQRWLAKAEELRKKQLAAAKRVDKALAAAEKAWAEYVALADERGGAVVQAGGTWVSKHHVRHLPQAAFASCPTVAARLGVSTVLRNHARKLEELVG